VFECGADLPRTPQNNKKEIIVTALKSKLKNVNVFSKLQGIKAKVVA
jgi:hypothetical protein